MAPVKPSNTARLTKQARYALVCVGLAGLWWHRSHTVSDFAPPMPTLPTPNAHDTYVAVYKLLRDERKIGFAINFDLPDTEVGRSFYTTDNHPYTPTQKRQLVQENLGALTRLRLGLQQAYYAPPVRSFQTRLLYYRSFDSLAQALLLEQQGEAARGEAANAVNTGLDAIAFGESMAHGADIGGKRAGELYAAPCRLLLWPAMAHLSGPKARMAAQKLENILDRHVAYADALQEEKWTCEGSLLEILQGNNLLKYLANAGVKEYDGLEGKSLLTLDGWRAVPRNAPFLLAGKRGALVEYARYMDQRIANARLPYTANPPEPTPLAHPLNRALMPYNMWLRKAQYNPDANRFAAEESDVAQNRLLLTALALRAYRSERGHCPDTLSELVPNYLRAVPDDPFASHAPLQYRRKDTNYILYSIGPDGRDNGGTPIRVYDDPPPAPPCPYDKLSEGSTGDIVAGFNN